MKTRAFVKYFVCGCRWDIWEDQIFESFKNAAYNDKNYWMEIQHGLEELFSMTKTTGWNTTWVRGTIFNDINYLMKMEYGLEELFSTTKTTGWKYNMG